MNTDREKERTGRGENEDVTENTLCQQRVAQKDGEVCISAVLLQQEPSQEFRIWINP